jgi:Uma2 family endonuclease
MEHDLLYIRPGERNVITEAKGGGMQVVPLSLNQYHRMIDEGILPEDSAVELLDGVLVPKDRRDAEGGPMVIGESHAYVVNQLARLLVKMDLEKVYVQTQQPIAIPEAGSEPEPDAAIVLRPMGTIGKPQASDIACVIEVAGSSLERDQTTKLRNYALGAIPQYIIIDLARRQAEEHLSPDPVEGRYRKSRIHESTGSMVLHLGGTDHLEVRLVDLLPHPS